MLAGSARDVDDSPLLVSGVRGDPPGGAELSRSRSGPGLSQAAALAPTDRALHTDLARACFDSAQLGRAESAFRALVGLDPTDLWARRGLARTLRRQSRHAEAAAADRIADALDA